MVALAPAICLGQVHGMWFDIFNVCVNTTSNGFNQLNLKSRGRGGGPRSGAVINIDSNLAPLVPGVVGEFEGGAVVSAEQQARLGHGLDPEVQ